MSWKLAARNCNHGATRLQSDGLLFALMDKVRARKHTMLRDSASLGQKGVAYSKGEAPTDRCMHPIFMESLPSEMVDGGKLVEGLPEDWWKKLTTWYLVWSSGKRFKEVARFVPCTDCVTQGCEACEQLGWVPERLAAGTFGFPGPMLTDGQKWPFDAVRAALPEGWRPLDDAMRAVYPDVEDP